MLAGRRILLIIGGGIAAYKSLELIRRLKENGTEVLPLMTEAAEEFVTPLSVSALAGHRVYRDLFDLVDEAEMGHIQLSRTSDLVVVAPATANLIARMANGTATDLASTVLLATDKKVLIAPAMNVRMWNHPSTSRNLKTLLDDGVRTVGPNEGDMACGEYGPGRMAEPDQIISAIEAALLAGPLNGKHVVVTSGPTHEPIDPVRYLGNRSSGNQGAAIADALSAAGAHVTFVTGPATSPMPGGCHVVRVQTAVEMKEAVENALPADAAVMVAAVADWRVRRVSHAKISKTIETGEPARPGGDEKGIELELVENPDILAMVSNSPDRRPRIVVGFAAETQDVIERAKAKRKRKGCDWIVANDVNASTGIMGGPENQVMLVTETGVEEWPRMSKAEVARRLAERLTEALTG